MNLNVSRMTLRDVDAVYAIEQSTFVMPWQREDFVYEMTQNPCARYLIASVDDRIVGFAGTHVVLDEGHITNIAVLETYRGRGIGRALLDGLMRYAANLGVVYMTLEVRASNARAQALYTSKGFQKVGIRKKYYEDNQEDALIMACDCMPEADPDFAEPETMFTEM